MLTLRRRATPDAPVSCSAPSAPRAAASRRVRSPLPGLLLLFAAGYAVNLPVAVAAEPSPFAAPKEVRQYDIWECRLDPARFPVTKISNDGALAPVYARVTPPSGARTLLRAFINQDFVRRPGAAGETLVKQGGPFWCFRYAPREPGRHRVEYCENTAEGKTLAESSFSAVAAPGANGFVGVSRTHPTRFAFDSGRGYFALGHNVCWVDKQSGLSGFDRYFAKMAAAGENYTRVWLCTWGIHLDGSSPYSLDLAEAWKLDHVFAEAANLGIYVKLCFDNFYDFRNNWQLSPFNRANGGPCAGRADFFTDEKAMRQYLARLDYLVSRYGAHSSLLAWELWNETDYSLVAADLGPAAEKDSYAALSRIRSDLLVPWTLAMARAVKVADPHRHLVTTSLGLHSQWDELWRDESLDFVQYHSYIHYLDLLRSETEKDAAAFALQRTALVGVYNKPCLLAEFGFMGEGEASSLNKLDPGGIALHNSIWAGALSGAAGTPMQWWWDNYIDPNDLYRHYRALSAFLRGTEWNADWTPMRVETGGVRVLALRGESHTLLWVQNLANTWHNRVKVGRQPRTLKGIGLKLSGFPAGKYACEWFDTYAGRPLATVTLDASGDEFRLEPPDFQYDVAARLDLVK